MHLAGVLFIFFLSSLIHGQQSNDSLDLIIPEDASNFLTTKLEKQLNIYYLNSGISINEKYDRLFFSLKENYQSTLIKSIQKNIRNEQIFNLNFSYCFAEWFNAGLGIGNNTYSDDRKVEINNASFSSALLFTQISPLKEVIISPFLGYADNKQMGENDFGYVYGAETGADNLKFSDFDITGLFKFRNEDISPRKNSLRNINLLLASSFSDAITNSITAHYSSNRKDFYYEADSLTSREFSVKNNIQSRDESVYLLQDRLSYENFLPNVGLDLLGKIFWRNIDRDTRYISLQRSSPALFDTRITELKVELDASAHYRSEKLNSSLQLNISERDEKHLTKKIEGISNIFYEERSKAESQKNNSSLRITLAVSGSWKISSTEKLFYSLLQNKLVYDTPSDQNFDDRDELLSIVRLRYARTLSPFFEGFVNVEGTQSQIAYIYSQKSSNNNVNRILSLSSGGTYAGKNFSSMNSFEVSANYTVYDYQDLNPNYRSFSFRQFTALDSTTLKLTSRLVFSHYGYIKLSEQGDFNWAKFSTRPNRYLTEIYIEPKLSLYYFDIKFSAGLRYFTLKTYSYRLMQKQLDSDYRSLGPLTEIYVNLNGRLYIKINGWYEFISTETNMKRELANLFLDINWKL